MAKKIYVISPVKNITANDQEILERYIATLEQAGHIVHFPLRDTNQTDQLKGYTICCTNFEAIRAADEIHYYYSPSSTGSFFDLGIAFYEHRLNQKPIILINEDAVRQAIHTGNKTRGLEFVALTLHELANHKS